jgi:hypothetical protein
MTSGGEGSHSNVQQIHDTNGTARRLPENTLATRLLRMDRCLLRFLDLNSVDSPDTVERGLCRERDTRISDQDKAKRRRPILISQREAKDTFKTYPRLGSSK